jgi:tetratricopeptide (TPR) repeat protein
MDWDKYAEAMNLNEAGKIDEALSMLHRLVGTSEDCAENHVVLIGIANCLRRLRRYDEARTYVHKAYAVLGKQHHFYPGVMFIEASIEDDQRHFKRAVERLDALLKEYPAVLTDPDYEDLKIKVSGILGINLFNLARYSEARPPLELAVKNNYWIERTLFHLGACCAHLGDLKNAERTLKEALALDLSPAYLLWTHYYLAMTYLWGGNNAWARQEFEWCLAHSDDGAVRKDYIIVGLMKTSEALGQKDQAHRYSEMLRQP